MTADQAWNRFFQGLPGAWFGNRPDSNMDGNVTIDATRIMDAIPYIKRRGFVIVSTKASRYPGGILLTIRTKPGPASDVAYRAGYNYAAGYKD